MNPLFQLCVCVCVCEHACGRCIYWVWVSLLPPLMPCDCHHHHQSWHLVSSLQLTKIACTHSPSFGPHENLGWGQDILLYYNLLIEERLGSSTLPSTRDCLCLQEKPLHETGKDAGTRDDLRKKGPDSHLLCREDVEDVLCVGRGWWDCLGENLENMGSLVAAALLLSAWHELTFF